MKNKKDRDGCSDADRRLFLQAMGQLEGEIAKAEDTKKQGSEFLDALQGEIAKDPEFRLKKQAIERRPAQAEARNAIEATLDLHASTLEMAMRRTEEFLLRCHVKRYRRVLVIHGKGAGILKEGIRRYLEHHPYVAQIISANKTQGGDGAVVVLLRRG